MGAEHPTGTDTKVETDDQPKPSDKPPPPPPDRPGSPGQPSRLESRAAAQRPPEAEDERREAPPTTRSARAEKSNDPNDDPNRVGTPRADSWRAAMGKDVSHAGTGGAEKTDDQPGARAAKDDDTRDSRTSHGDSGQDEEAPRRETPREKQEQRDTDEGPKPYEGRLPDQEAPETGRPGDAAPAPLGGRADGERPAVEARTADSGEQIADGQSPLRAGRDTAPHEDRSPAEETPPADDAPLPDQHAPESDTEVSERIPDGQTDPERETEPSPEASDGEPPVGPGRWTPEEPVDDPGGIVPEMGTPEDAPGRQTSDGTTDEPGDDAHDRGKNAENPTEAPTPEETKDPFANLPTRADLDPVGAGVLLPDRGELTPVNENQDLREPERERDSPFKRALRGMSNDTEDALKNANAISDDLQGALGSHRPPSDFPTGSRDVVPTMKGADNPMQIPSVLVGVVSGAIVLHSMAHGIRGLITSSMRRNSDRN